MALLFQLLCTFYFAALTWTLYSVLSTPRFTPRPLLFGIVGATALLFVLHATFGAILGSTTEAIPKDKFFVLLQFSGALVMIQVVNPWLRKTFATGAAQKRLPVAGTEKLLAINALLANKAMFGMIFLYQLIAIWLPGML